MDERNRSRRLRASDVVVVRAVERTCWNGVMVSREEGPSFVEMFDNALAEKARKNLLGQGVVVDDAALGAEKWRIVDEFAKSETNKPK